MGQEPIKQGGVPRACFIVSNRMIYNHSKLGVRIIHGHSLRLPKSSVFINTYTRHAWAKCMECKRETPFFPPRSLTFGFAFENGYVDLICLVKFFQYGEIHFAKKIETHLCRPKH